MSQEMDAAATIGDVSSDAPEQAPDLAVGVTGATQAEAEADAHAQLDEGVSTDVSSAGSTVVVASFSAVSLRAV